MIKILKKYTRTASGRLWASPGSLTNTDLILNSNWCSRLFLRTCDHPAPAGRWPAWWCRLAFHEICRNTVRVSLLLARACLSHGARGCPKAFLSMAIIHKPQPVNNHCSRPALINCFSLCLGDPWFSLLDPLVLSLGSLLVQEGLLVCKERHRALLLWSFQSTL